MALIIPLPLVLGRRVEIWTFNQGRVFKRS
jgi:hypothetical protein